MLGNVLWALLRLCEPFLTARDPKAEALADKTDLDYFRGSDRVSRWLDQRNQSRIAQFEANRAALLASASSSSSSSPSPGNNPQSTAGAGAGGGEREEKEEKEIDPKSKSFGTTAEFAGLAARLLHVGIGQRVKQCQTRLEEGALTKLMLQLVDMDPDIVLPSLRFLRFQASRLIKHASIGRGITRNAMGEPLPPLPMPPPPRFAMLPAHLMEDVSDMIKFAAYTCPPDSRSGLTPLELITPIEASGILSFLVLFIGTSGYMRNPYIRAKMVEALVAFLPEVKKRRDYPTPSSMTSSPSAASRPSSWNTCGPSALTGKASSATRRTAQSLFGSLTCSSTTASITWTRR
ncbi:unnamed protein product [Ectocarpus sp. 12 AP-2014]